MFFTPKFNGLVARNSVFSFPFPIGFCISPCGFGHDNGLWQTSLPWSLLFSLFHSLLSNLFWLNTDQCRSSSRSKVLHGPLWKCLPVAAWQWRPLQSVPSSTFFLVYPPFQELPTPDKSDSPLTCQSSSPLPGPTSHLVFKMQFKSHFPRRASLPTRPEVSSHIEPLPLRRGALRGQGGRAERRINHWVHTTMTVSVLSHLDMPLCASLCISVATSTPEGLREDPSVFSEVISPQASAFSDFITWWCQWPPSSQINLEPLAFSSECLGPRLSGSLEDSWTLGWSYFSGILSGHQERHNHILWTGILT